MNNILNTIWMLLKGVKLQLTGMEQNTIYFWIDQLLG